jgi:ABC-2 type transport system permease protein
VVGLFLRLKLRLIRGSLRGDVAKQIGFVVSVTAAAFCAFFGFLLFALLRVADADLAQELGIVAFAGFAATWTVVPLLAFGLDETLDPSRLALFPLSTRQLAMGMLTAGAAGPWPMASLIVLLGAVIGLGRSITGIALGVVAVCLEFAFCLVLSRTVTTALSGVLRSRRGRDLLAVAAVLVVVAFQVPNLLINRGVPGDGRALLDSAAAVLRWAPPGLAAHAIADGGLAGLGELVVVAASVVALAWLWIVALRRALVTPDSSSQGAGSVRRSWIGGFLPRGRLGAVVAKELKYARREPRGRIGWISAVVVSGFLAFSMQLQGMAFAFVPPSIAALMIGLQTANVYGIDGRALWMNAVAFTRERDVRTDLAGRHLGFAIIAVPLLTVLAVVFSLLAGHPGTAVPAALTAWGVLGLGLGAGAVTSVLSPYTLPERMNAFNSAAPGQGGLMFVSSFGAMLVTILLAGPVVVLVLVGFTWVSVLAVPYGLAVSLAGRRLAGMVGWNRLPDLLAAVARPT